MASGQPTTPKKPTTGAPMGSKKTPKQTTPPRSEQSEKEPPRTPMPGQYSGDDGDDDDVVNVSNPNVAKPDIEKPEAEKPDVGKPEDAKPEALDEAIDLGDNEDQARSEEGETNIEAPSEIEQGGEDAAEQVGEHGVEQPEEEDLEELGEEGVEQPDEEGVTELGEEGAEKAGEEGVEVPDEEGVEKAGEEGVEKAGEEGVEVPDEEDVEKPLDFSILEGKKVNKGGFIVDENGNQLGKLIEGEAKKLAGKQVDKDGNIWNDSGKIIGKAEPIPVDDREPASLAPFEDFPDAVVDVSGKVLFEGRKVGIVTEGDPKELAGKKVDPDGDILDRHGNVIGKSIREDEEEPEAEPEAEPEKVDYSALAGLRVNKAGNVVTESGKLVGRVIEGSLKSLIGKTVDAEGNIHNDVGKVIGKAEPIPDNEKEDPVETPFEDFPGSIVDKSGDILFEGKVIGKVIEGDAKKLAGKTVDPEGDIVDKNGTVLGKAERWEEEEEAPPEEVDRSILAGKRVNKAGNVVDSSGTIYGKLVEGDVKALAGRMCDKQGFVRNESGDVVGKAELVPEGDREGLKTGPFADFNDCTVGKDGTVVCDKGVVGKLVEGDPKKLFGKAVDEDGDVLDKNGTVVGKAERWEEEEVKKEIHPLSGLKVNKNGEVYDSSGELAGKLTEGDLGRCAGQKIDDDGQVVDQKGNTIGHVTLIGDIKEPEDVHPLAGLQVNKNGEVYDSNGELVGKLTEGELSRCAGQKIDNDGDVVDRKGTSIGHVNLIRDIKEPEPEPEEQTEEEKKAEENKKLAIAMSRAIQSSLDQIQPVLKRITELINTAEAKPKDEVDEEKLVDEVKPLIEEGGRILTEVNGTIRGLDPDGRIAANAKHKTAAGEATPEEYHLADLLKELTGNVITTIDNAKKKIDGLPHAKKELNPLWGLLSEPLFQILAAVGLLLSGVLGLVSQLLNGLGLGGLVRGVLGGLGITRVLDGLGLGKILAPITGSKKK